jgi:hypothetical protein
MNNRKDEPLLKVSLVLERGRNRVAKQAARQADLKRFNGTHWSMFGELRVPDGLIEPMRLVE